MIMQTEVEMEDTLFNVSEMRQGACATHYSHEINLPIP